MAEQDEDHPEEYMIVVTADGREEMVDLFDYMTGGYIDGIIDFIERRRLLESLPKMEPKNIDEANNNENPLLKFKAKKYEFNFENPPKPAELPPIPHSSTLRKLTTDNFMPREDEEKLLSKKAQFKDMCKRVYQ